MMDPIDNVLRVLSNLVLLAIVLLSLGFFIALALETLT